MKPSAFAPAFSLTLMLATSSAWSQATPEVAEGLGNAAKKYNGTWKTECLSATDGSYLSHQITHQLQPRGLTSLDGLITTSYYKTADCSGSAKTTKQPFLIQITGRKTVHGMRVDRMTFTNKISQIVNKDIATVTNGAVYYGLKTGRIGYPTVLDESTPYKKYIPPVVTSPVDKYIGNWRLTCLADYSYQVSGLGTMAMTKVSDKKFAVRFNLQAFNNTSCSGSPIDFSFSSTYTVMGQSTIDGHVVDLLSETDPMTGENYKDIAVLIDGNLYMGISNNNGNSYPTQIDYSSHAYRQ